MAADYGDFSSLFYFDTSTGEWYMRGALNIVAGAGTLVVDDVAVTAATDLSGVTATSTEINLIDGSIAGTSVASKALVLGANKNTDILALPVSGLKIGAGAGTAVDATAAELNLINTSVAGTAVASKAAVLGADKNLDVLAVADLKLGAGAGTSVTATAAEINKVAGVTGGTAAASKAVVLDANSAVNAVKTAALHIGTSGSEVNVTAAVQELAAKGIGTATFVVGSETTGAVTVNVQLKDFAGADLAVRGVVEAFVSTDANGDSPGDGGATLALTAGTDGAVLPGADASARATFISESDGDIDIVVTDSGAATQTCYLHIITPLGEVISSTVLTFAA